MGRPAGPEDGAQSPDSKMTEFREFLPDLSSPRFKSAKEQDPYQYAQAFAESHHPPWLYKLTQAWEELLAEPFKGVTTDGNVLGNIYELQESGIDMALLCAATNALLDQVSSEQARKLRYPVNAKEWRCWSNPEFLLRPLGLRLEELPDDAIMAILRIIELTFSQQGYEKALAAMRINHFLGQLCNIPKAMNQYSYNFLLFGRPSEEGGAWGWTLYGHHLCLTAFFKGTHVTISPTFTGAEPNVIDVGPYSGTAILHREGALGLQLMQGLPAASQQKAQIYRQLRDPQMLQTGDLKLDRWNQDDQRHVCGAFRDNRIVPYEGVNVQSTFSAEQKDLLLNIVEQFVLYLPDRARQARLQQVQRHFAETFFCWIGGWSDSDAYYFRIQSPVIVCEFDHHSGVFLTNKEPAKFHTHTIVRSPNAGDYGNALRSAEEEVL